MRVPLCSTRTTHPRAHAPLNPRTPFSPKPPPPRYYAIDGPPPGSYIAELIEAVRLPGIECEHLRIPAKEARDKRAAKEAKEKAQAQVRAIKIPPAPERR